MKTLIVKISEYLLIFVISLFILVTFVNPSKVFSSEPLTFYEITVQDGDTIWDLASTYNTNQVDIRRLVYEIKQINQIDNTYICPGDIINIPILK